MLYLTTQEEVQRRTSLRKSCNFRGGDDRITTTEIWTLVKRGKSRQTTLLPTFVEVYLRQVTLDRIHPKDRKRR